MRRYVLCLGRDDRIEQLCDIYAHSTNAELWTGDIGNLESGSTVIVFGSPSEFTPDVLRRFAHYSTSNIHIGIMTAKTHSHLEQFCVRNHVKLSSMRGNGRIVTLAFNENGSDQTGGRHEIYYGDNAKIEIIASHDDYELATLCTHGRDDILFMADGGICGYDEEDSSANNGELPACAFGPQCVSRRGRVPIKNLKTQMLMINSCLALKLTPGIFGSKYLLGLSAMTNPNLTTVVASDSIQAGHEYYNHLFVQCLIDGLSVGEAVSHLNTLIVKTRNDIARFNILGDPDIRLSTTSIRQNLPPEHSKVHNERRIEIEGLVENKSFESATRRRMALDSLQATGIHTQRLQGLMKDAVMQYNALAKLYHEALVDCRIRGKLENKVKTMNQTCKQIDHELLSFITEKSHTKNYYFPETYHPLFDVAGVNLVECPACGKIADKITRKSYYCSSTRIQVNCPVCGIVADEPEDQTFTTSISLAQRFVPGAPIDGSVTIQGLSLRADMEVSVVLVRGEKYGIQFHDLQIHRGEEREILLQFVSNLIPEDTLPHNYWVRVYLVIDGLLSCYHRNIWIIPKRENV